MAERQWDIGVFTSIDAGLGVALNVAGELAIPTIHLHAPQPKSRNTKSAQVFLKRLESLGIRLTAVFGGFDGESYADIPTVVRTVGLVPPATRAARVVEMKEISDFAVVLGCDVVALHLGFVPHDVSSKEYQEIIAVTRDLCRHCANNSQSLHLETGQETADGLVQFIDDVAAGNLYVNFDPANMILYGAGEPIAAVRKLGKRIRSVHCKDATWSKSPGETWGSEMPLGEGDVNIANYLQALKEIGYRGPLTIEREIPQEPKRQKAEILHASGLLTKLRSEILWET